MKMLDAIDQKLIASLEKDARRPVVALAKAVGLSRTAVQGRLARLEGEGTIRGYTVVRGGHGTGQARAFLFVSIDTRPCDPVLSRLTNLPEVVGCWSVAGSALDAIVLIEAPTMDGLGAVRASIAAIQGVADVTTAPVLRTVLAAMHRSRIDSQRTSSLRR